jgi:LacI family transcriptional regulator
MATMKDVAAKAGVSVFTVSSVINNSNRIRPSTRARVLAAIAELDYIPNSAARSLRTQRSDTIGVMFPLFSSNASRAFFGPVAEGVHAVLRERGYHMILSTANSSADEEQRELDNLIRKDIDGLIYAPVFCRDVSLAKAGFPVVIVDRDLPGSDFDKVFNNNLDSAFEAVQYLIDKGHRKIAYIGRKTGFSNHRERYLGYKKALEKNGIKFDPALVKSATSPETGGIVLGYTACKALAAKKTTAIFCNESYGTIGVLKYAHEQGIKIPGQLAVITYDDLEWSEIVDPPLSAVKQPAYEMGAKAAEMLINRIENPASPFQINRVASELILRGST